MTGFEIGVVLPSIHSGADRLAPSWADTREQARASVAEAIHAD